MTDVIPLPKPKTHGVLVTFQRPALLSDHLKRLSSQTQTLESLVIVDNDANPHIRSIVDGPIGQAAACSVHYLASPGNPGPAGGFTAGISVALGFADDDDLIVLLDDNDPPRTDDVFADSLSAYQDLSAHRSDIGGVGSWGAVLHRRGRLRMAVSEEPALVHYLAGGACPHYRVSALRGVGGPDPALFFGFEELDLGLALQRSGYSLWSTGLARAHGWSEAVQPTRASAGVEAVSWRRYYSIRNLVVVLRKDGRTADALFVSAVVGLGKPIANLAIRPTVALANLRLNIAGLADAWRRRLGKRIDPNDQDLTGPRHVLSI